MIFSLISTRNTLTNFLSQSAINISQTHNPRNSSILFSTFNRLIIFNNKLEIWVNPIASSKILKKDERKKKVWIWIVIIKTEWKHQIKNMALRIVILVAKHGWVVNSLQGWSHPKNSATNKPNKMKLTHNIYNIATNFFLRRRKKTIFQKIANSKMLISFEDVNFIHSPL